MKNDTLKDYYINLETLWNNAVNILTAINQSLHTNSSEITVNITDTDDSVSTVRLPSFLYLENKLETLDNNFSNLFNLPSSGEAWFSSNENSNMYKLQMLKSGVAPITPNINGNSLIASLTDSNILKDLVSPKTFLKVNIDNLPDNIENIFVKKIIINNYSHFSLIQSSKIESYEDFNNIVYNLKKGIDYTEYDSVLNVPIKTDRYKSIFKIINIPGENNPWVANANSSKYSYKIELDTLKYHNAEDSSIEHTLKIGDKLTINNELAIYKITNVSTSSNTIEIEEVVGHLILQTFEENSEMAFSIYNNDYSEYKYVEIPLEENPYIILFIGHIYNNVRSHLSKPLVLDLNSIYMTDANQQQIYDEFGNKLTYMQYYQKYCTNIGDLILGLTESAYPQLSFLNNSQLELIQDSITIKNIVNSTIDANTILKVVPINKHIIDNTTTEEIISLHSQKNELNSRLTSLNNSISSTTNKLITTDFQQEVSVTRQSLQSELNEYYSSRKLLQQQLISVVENINSNIGLIEGKTIKYRIRGFAKTEDLENYIHTTFDNKLDIIGIDVEYKYKSLNKSETTITSINSNVFTDWNKLVTIDKQRHLEFDLTTNNYKLVWDNYNSTNNIIKWNQLDIPIVADEDVIIRIRFKYNIGQPFVNIYTPWSDEITMVFPAEYKDNIEVNAIITENQKDIISANFNKTLLNEGYQEHITNSLVSNDRVFYHMPDNIYSGFTTAENNLISLKDKLIEMSNEIETYKSWVESEINQKYSIYLTFDNKSIELFNNSINKIDIFNDNHIVNSFIRKDMNIVIKNTGKVPIKLYSIFPGNIDIPLLLNTDEFFQKEIGNYDRVPMIVNNVQTYQRLGQWIYFRQNNPWTSEDIYYNTYLQRKNDLIELDHDKVKWGTESRILMKQKNSQVLLGYRERTTTGITQETVKWTGLLWNGRDMEKRDASILQSLDTDDTLLGKYANKPIDFFMYSSENNNYLMRFEDIYYEGDDGNRYYLDHKTPLVEFVSQHNISGGFRDDIDFTGAFLFPNLDNINQILTQGGLSDYMSIEVGKSISIPITLEYYLGGDIPQITKSLYFDIQTSKLQQKEHYMIEINSIYDYTSSGQLINNISLMDDTVEI